MDCFMCVAAIIFSLVTIYFFLSIYYFIIGAGDEVSPNKKTVFISGCDSGFGFLTANRLSSLNYHVIAACLSDQSDGAKNLTEKGNVDVIKCDVTSDDDVMKARDVVEKQLKENGNVLWAIVNNAGINHTAFIEGLSMERLQEVMNVNAMGMVRVVKALVPFVRRCSGRIVNVASQAGYGAVPGLCAYVMSKHAVIGFSKTLRLELAHFGVHVAIIAPLYYKTPILGNEGDSDHQVEECFNQSPEHVQRDYGRDFYQGFFDKRTKIVENAREDLNEVIDNIQHAVCSRCPNLVYNCHWTTTLIYRRISPHLPAWLLDWILVSKRLPVKPAAVK